MIKVLLIDDEPQIRQLLSRIIMLESYAVEQAENLRVASRKLTAFRPDVVLCDVRLPDGNGIDFIRTVKELLPDTEVILLTAHGNIADGVQAIKNGAFNYLTKGDDNNRIIPLLADASEKVVAQRRLHPVREGKRTHYTFEDIVGSSNALKVAVDMAGKVAATHTTILLTGETGTGKEVFAHAIHEASGRGDSYFVAVNCAAFSRELLESEMFGHRAGAFTGAVQDKKGLFEQADQGTIFLDEVGEMPLDLQAKLLRVLESGTFLRVGDTVPTQVDVRIIAATNRNLKTRIAEGNFREDLFYRLSVFTIDLPPLRGRRDDIVALSRSFIEQFSVTAGKRVDQVEPAFLEALTRHQWPGNVRELRNVIERSIILSSDSRLVLSDLPYEIQVANGVALSDMELAHIERQHILKILAYTGGNKTETARLLKIGLTTLYRKLEEYRITVS